MPLSLDILAVRRDVTPDEPGTLSRVWSSLGEALPELGEKLLSVAGIIAVCVVIAWLLRMLIRRTVTRIVRGAKTRANVDDTRALERSPLASVRVVQRTRTLGSILTNVTGVAMAIVAIVWSATVVAPDAVASLSLLTAAIGAGLGFGAQNIVKDVLNGIFIVAEDQIGIGDVVDLGLATGVVEFVSVRITHVRDVHGVLWYVRNGEILRIGNMTQGWARAVIDISVPADVDLPAVEQVIGDAARTMWHDRTWRSRIIDRPEVWGLESSDGDTLVVRLVAKTRPNVRDDVAQELRSRVRDALIAADTSLSGIESVTLDGNDGALRVRGINPPTVTNPIPERPKWRPWGRRSGSDTDADE